MKTIETLESEVRSYVRTFPAVFERARGHELFDEHGRSYIDFFAGAGSLNYGHNNPRLKGHLVQYLWHDGVTHTLDMATHAKRTLLERFHQVILEPRGLDYKFLFPGPTGTNAIEAALKLARKVTGRSKVYSFDGGFHGMTLGSLAITSNEMKRGGAGVPLRHARLLPFDGQSRDGMESIDYLERTLRRDSEENELPAAIVLETVQCEGGVNVASFPWLRGVARLCKDRGILLIVDDIQAGCGRTGSFFSFDEAGIQPDVVCLSKSLSGFGLPMALVLFRRELDVWKPGEHNGTFRGHNLAFVTATEALRFWETDELAADVKRKARIARHRLETLAAEHPAAVAEVRGRGLVQGMAMEMPGLAGTVSRLCFERGLVIETAGRDDEVLKLLPPLTIQDDALHKGLSIIETCLNTAVRETRSAALAMA